MILWCGRLMTGNVAVWVARTTEVIVDVATNRFVFTTIIGSMMVAAWGPWWVFPTAIWATTAVIAATCGWSAANRHQERRRRVLNQLQRARR